MTPRTPDDEPAPVRGDVEIESLLEEILDALEEGSGGAGRAVLERLCQEHPASADELRRRVARLEAHGILGGPADDRTAAFPRPGERFGPWTAGDLLGRGAMGLVFRAIRTDAPGDPPVALKVVDPALSVSGRARFAREARTLQDLVHPCLCRVLDVGEAAGTPWIAMELVPGGNLESRINRSRRVLDAGTDPVLDAARLVAETAEGLAVAHRQGVVHRDIKPTNILVRDDGTPVLIDFGLARTEDTTRLTATDAPIGTPAYMAPEQVRGAGTDARTDVHALGAVLYELLSLRPPFDAAARDVLYRLILEADPPDLRRLNPSVPARLAHIVGRCLEKRPARRYADASELAADLRRFLDGRSVHARAPSWARRTARTVRRHPVPTLAAVAGVLAVALLAVSLVGLRLRARAVSGALVSSLATRRQSEVQARRIASEALAVDANLRSRSQAYRLAVDARVGGVWPLAGVSGCMDAAVSPDGGTLAVAARAPQPVPWRIVPGGPRTRTVVVEGSDVVWDPAGSGQLATLVGPHTVRVFDAATGRSTEYRLDDPMRSRSFSRPARCAAFVGGDLWVGTSAGEVLRIRRGAERPEPIHRILAVDGILAVAAVPDGGLVVSRYGTVTVLDPDGRVVAAPLDRGAVEDAGVGYEKVDRVVFDPITGALAVARRFEVEGGAPDRCQLELWRLPDPAAGAGGAVREDPAIARATLGAGPVDLQGRSIDVAVSPDGTRAAAITERGEVLVIGPSFRYRATHGLGAAWTLAFAGNDRLVVTSLDECLLLGSDANLLARSTLARNGIPALLPGSDPDRMLTLGVDGTLREFVVRRRDAPVVVPDGRTVHAARWLDRRRFVTAASPHLFALYRRDGTPVRTASHGRRPALHRLAVAPEGDWLLGCAEKVRTSRFQLMPHPSVLLALDARTLERVGYAASPELRWRAFAFVPRRGFAVAVDGRRLVRVGRPAEGGRLPIDELVVGDSPRRFDLLACAAGDTLVTSGAGTEVLEAWTLAGTARGEARPPASVTALAGDGDRVLVGCEDGSLAVRDPRTLAVLQSLPRQARAVTALAATRATADSPATRLVAAGNAGGLLTVFAGDPATPRLEYDFDAGIDDLDWSPDGTALLVTTTNRTVRVLPLLSDGGIHAKLVPERD